MCLFQFSELTDNLQIDYDTAREICTSMGADLVSITSEEEQIFVYEKLKYVSNMQICMTKGGPSMIIITLVTWNADVTRSEQ